MNILITAATQFEIASFINEIEAEQINSTLYLGVLNNCKIDIAVTGVGLVNTTFNTLQLLTKNKYDLALNAGIAGCYSDEYSIGEVFNVVSEVFTDFGIDNNGDFVPIKDVSFFDEHQPPFKNGIMKNSTNGIKLLDELVKVNGGSSDLAHGSEKQILRCIKHFNVDVESMEGAAFFYTCLRCGVPFYEIRAVSNKVEPRNPLNWNIDKAIENLNRVLIAALLNYPSCITSSL